MEKNNKEKTCEMEHGCGSPCCAMSGMTGHHKFFFLRWILGLVIMLMILFLGIKIGEFKSLVDNEFGFSRQNIMYKGHGPGMMQYYFNQNPSAVMPVPASSSTTKTTTATPKK